MGAGTLALLLTTPTQHNSKLTRCSRMSSMILLQIILAHFFTNVKSNICCYRHESDNRTMESLHFNSIKLITRPSKKVEASPLISRNYSRILIEKQTSARQAYRMIMLESFQIKRNKTCKNELSQPGWNTPGVEDRLEWNKNYASVECGAKLIRASESMKNPSHLISRNADEYMLYQCREASYFVIELCETIRVIRFELDNKELYSGTPRNFTVRTADKYSTDPNDWNLIGGFEASSEKMETQNFSGLKVKTFGKFIRVDINSFHGNEHFCTLTSLRVFGLTEYDFLSMNDDESDHNDNYLTLTDDKSQSQTYSSRRIRVEMKDEMTIYTYEYIFLQTGKDICFENRENNSTNLITNDNTKGMKKEKDSVLVGLSNKVKILEKNLTSQSVVLRNLENNQVQQNKDMNKIHKINTKTDETFKAFSKDSEEVKTKVTKHEDKIRDLEKEMSKFEDSLFVATGICACLAMICNLLILFICCFNRKESTKSNQGPVVPTSKRVKDSEVQTVTATTATPTANTVKKVTFSDDNNNEGMKACKDEDISMKLNVRRIVRKDPNRRVTWCPGTFKKLAYEAKQLIREI